MLPIAPRPSYCYKASAKMVDDPVKDGDTFLLFVDLGMDGWTFSEIRLSGIDAYETTRRGRWDDGMTPEQVEECIQRGHAAKAFARDKILNAENIIVQTFRRDTTGRTKKGKFGRWIGDVWVDDENLGAMLVEEGLAVIREY